MKNTVISAALALSGLLLVSGAGQAVGLLTAPSGKTLYTFDSDTGGTPSCYDKCAANWPPYLAGKGAKMKTGWTTVARKDGKMQWAYDAKPVYFFKGDKKKGDKNGDGLQGLWHVVNE